MTLGPFICSQLSRRCMARTTARDRMTNTYARAIDSDGGADDDDVNLLE